MGRKGWFAKYSGEEARDNLLHSHAGNNLFPSWEHFIPTLGINSESHLYPLCSDVIQFV